MSEVADRIKTLSQFYLHSPSDLAQSFVAYAERIQKEDGITYGCILDSYMTPLRPGNTMAVVARPGHGKSSFMAYLMRREARAIIDRGKVGQECVYYVGWDQPAEETDAFFQANGDYTSSDLAWGRADIDAIRRNAIQRVAGIKRPPAPTMNDVYDLIHYNTYDGEKRLTPTLIVLDYIQKVPVGKGMKRVDAVTEATFQATELASRVG
jgi:hypothetical protein